MTVPRTTWAPRPGLGHHDESQFTGTCAVGVGVGQPQFAGRSGAPARAALAPAPAAVPTRPAVIATGCTSPKRAAMAAVGRGSCPDDHDRTWMLTLLRFRQVPSRRPHAGQARCR